MAGAPSPPPQLSEEQLAAAAAAEASRGPSLRAFTTFGPAKGRGLGSGRGAPYGKSQEEAQVVSDTETPPDALLQAPAVELGGGTSPL